MMMMKVHMDVVVKSNVNKKEEITWDRGIWRKEEYEDVEEKEGP